MRVTTSEFKLVFMNNDIILPKLRKNARYYSALTEVTSSSKKHLRTACYKIAQFFQKEFKSDFVPFCENDNDTYKAYLFLDDEWFDRDVIGACCFRLRKYENVEFWAMQWIWIHPYYRNKGILKENWEHFRKKHGNFWVEPSYSKAMEAFLKKYQPSVLGKNFFESLKN